MSLHRRISHALPAAGVAIALTLGLAGCAVGGAENAGPAPDTTFSYASKTTFITEWDPASYYGNEDVVLDNVYETLTIHNQETGAIDPLLAESWTASDDKKTWTFTLRKDVTFHTGRVLDSTAVKEAIERTVEIDKAASYQWSAIESIETPADDTIVFHLSEPIPLDVHAASGFSAHIYDTRAADGDLAAWFNEGNDAGTGPYTVTAFNKGAETEVELEAYEDYWGGWSDNQFTDVEFRVVPSETTAWQLLQSGEIDFIDQVTSELFRDISASDDAVAITGPSYQNLIIALNTASGPLADVRVRQAVLKAIDVHELETVLNGAGTAASGLIPEGLAGFEPGLELTKDLDGARALLSEAGYSEEGSLELELIGSASSVIDEKFATLLTSSLAELGVTLDVEFLDGPGKVAAIRNEDTSLRPDISLRNWWPIYPDASSWFIDLVRFSDPTRANYSYLDIEEINTRIDSIPALTTTDPETLATVYSELAREVVEEHAATTGLIVKNSLRALAPGIDGYVDNLPYANVVFVHQLRLAP